MTWSKVYDFRMQLFWCAYCYPWTRRVVMFVNSKLKPLEERLWSDALKRMNNKHD